MTNNVGRADRLAVNSPLSQEHYNCADVPSNTYSIGSCAEQHWRSTLTPMRIRTKLEIFCEVDRLTMTELQYVYVLGLAKCCADGS